MSATVSGPDGKPRCEWCAAAPEFLHYHDTEWGFPVDDDFRLFEKLSLEGFQSGLSWRTILAKRENFRKAFLGFDYNKIARFTEKDVARLLQDEGIVRHRGKIEAVINNAQRAVELVKKRIAGGLHLAVRAQAGAARYTAKCINVCRVCRVLQGIEKTRMEIRRSHNRLRFHASHGANKRSCRWLYSA